MGHTANFMDLALAFFNLLYKQGPQRLKLCPSGVLQACAAITECRGAGERADIGTLKPCIHEAGPLPAAAESRRRFSE